MWIKWIILGSMLIINTAWAQDSSAFRLSLAEAVSLAKQRHEDLKISAQVGEGLRQQYREVRSHALPQVFGAVGWNHYFQAPKITLPGEDGERASQFPIKRDYDFSIDIRLTQVLWAFGKVQNAIAAADRAVSAQKLAHESAHNEVVFVVKSAYYNALVSAGALEIVEGSRRHVEDTRHELRERHQATRVSRFDHVKMEADAALRVPLVLHARKNHRLALTTLKSVVGLTPDVDVHLSDGFVDAFPAVDLGKLKTRALDANPALLALGESVALQDHMALAQKRNYFPTLSGVAAYSYSGDGDDFYIGRRNMFPTFSAGILLTFPIWDSGTISGRYGQALAERNIQDLKLRKLRRSLVSELDSAVTEYRLLGEVLDAQRTAVESAQRSYQMARSSALAGKSSLTEVNDAELQYTNARLSLEHVVFQLHMAKARMEYLTGGKEPL